MLCYDAAIDYSGNNNMLIPEETARMNAVMPVYLIQWLTEQAKLHDRTLSYMVRIIIKNAYDQQREKLTPQSNTKERNDQTKI